RESPVEGCPVRFINRRVLDINSKLHIVRPDDVRIIVHIDPHIIPAEVRKTRVNVKLSGIRNTAERRVRNKTIRVRVREKLRNIQVEIGPPICSQSCLSEWSLS